MFFGGGGVRKPTSPMVPYEKWTRFEVQGTGQPYICHPITGETKWLYQRYHDTPTKRDYLVNIVDKQRVWATAANAYLSPPLDTPPVSSTNGPAGGIGASRTPAHAGAASAAGAIPTRPEPAARSVARDDSAPGRSRSGGQARARPRELRAPASLGLGADEVLLEAPTTERKYIYNKRTRKSRWLDDGTAEPASAPPSHAPNGFDAVASDARSARPSSSDAPPDVKTGRASGSRAASGNTQQPTVQRNSSGRVQSTAAMFEGLQQDVPKSPVPASKVPRKRSGLPSKGKVVADIQRLARGFLVRRSGVLGKLRQLSFITKDMSKTVAISSKHDIQLLTRVVDAAPRVVPGANEVTLKEANQRLLELGEYLTQRMLIVDGVDSAGNGIVRRKRKETVKQILALIDKAEGLREKARGKL